MIVEKLKTNRTKKEKHFAINWGNQVKTMRRIGIKLTVVDAMTDEEIDAYKNLNDQMREIEEGARSRVT